MVLPQPAAVVMEVREVPMSMSVTPSHHHHVSPQLYLGPSPPLYLSAVYFVGTSTASGPHGLFAGPQFALTCQVSVKTTIFKPQQSVQDKNIFYGFPFVINWSKMKQGM
jgi:hypothetical protein